MGNDPIPDLVDIGRLAWDFFRDREDEKRVEQQAALKRGVGIAVGIGAIIAGLGAAAGALRNRRQRGNGKS